VDRFDGETKAAWFGLTRFADAGLESVNFLRA
jgi:hypothetical protein